MKCSGEEGWKQAQCIKYVRLFTSALDINISPTIDIGPQCMYHNNINMYQITSFSAQAYGSTFPFKNCTKCQAVNLLEL